MTALEAHCPECNAVIAVCDNDVWLDLPMVPWDGGHAQWTVMQWGNSQIATAGDASLDGKAHTLHEHQPPEGSMA